MSKLRVGIIGTGKKKERPDRLGYAMAYSHAAAYQALDSCEIAACADIVEENARAFAEFHGVKNVYTDYHKMLAEAELDMVSICAWVPLHEAMALDVCKAGVKAIHCEKPMAFTWGGARRMVAAAKEAGIHLTFNHQRRYARPYVMAKKMVDEGAIGDLVRLECGCKDVFDSGTHFIDIFSLLNGDQPAKWVLGQFDYREENVIFGDHLENQQVVLTEYENGVFGLIMTGAGGKSPVGCMNKAIGTDGVIEMGVVDGPHFRYRLAGQKEWTVPDLQGATIHAPGLIKIAIADVVACLLEGRKCQLDAGNALIATEIIFGAYESCRRRGRVDFPLDIEDNPFAAMIASGDLKPRPKDA
ncbi:MAG: Gfo/Idh/MocA family oxidoreductase [Armatimonadetes bacterium]|nr:Gfo/Idh/MocA family oxidoreductase [Armatimonadota bacterium]